MLQKQKAMLGVHYYQLIRSFGNVKLGIRWLA